MKVITARLLPALALALVAPCVWAAAGDPGTGIPSTLHDFSGNTIGTETSGTCTYCHTPHSAQTQALLWNQTTSGGPYVWAPDGQNTTGATPYATIATSNNGPSLKCLGCHDGTATAGDIGWFNGADPATDGDTQVSAPNIIGGGNDLINNHPVSMPFPTGGGAAVASTYNSVSNGAAAVASDWVADPEAVGIRLFNDTVGDGTGIVAGASGTSTGIECSSCHDPHNGGTVQDSYFLRGLIGGNTTDYICAKCHNR